MLRKKIGLSPEGGYDMEAAEKLYLYGRNHWRTGRGYLYSDNNPDALFDSGYKEYVTVVNYTVWQEIGLDVDYLRENDHIIWTKIETDPSKVMPDLHGRTTGLDEYKNDPLSTLWRIATAGINAGAQNVASIETHSIVPNVEDYYLNMSDEVQRVFWATGAEIGYAFGAELTWYLLTHSLEKYPEDVVIEEGISNLFDSFIEKIKNDTYFKRKLDEYLQGKTVSFSMESTDGLDFSDSGNFDLKSAINKCELWFAGEKNEDGSWNLEIELRDTYDFTEFKNPLFEPKYVEQPKLGRTDKRWKLMSKNGIFANMANDGAYISQKLGAITPFLVIIRFTIENYGVERV